MVLVLVLLVVLLVVVVGLLVGPKTTSSNNSPTLNLRLLLLSLESDLLVLSEMKVNIICLTEI